MVSFSHQQKSNPIAEAEYHKSVIVKDVARMFGRQDSSSAGEILFGGMERNYNVKESPESPILPEDQKDYMSPIVSLTLNTRVCIILFLLISRNSVIFVYILFGITY